MASIRPSLDYYKTNIIVEALTNLQDDLESISCKSQYTIDKLICIDRLLNQFYELGEKSWKE